MPRSSPGRRVPLPWILLGLAGCHTTPPPTAPTAPSAAAWSTALPATSPTTSPAAPQVFDDSSAGIRFTYPAGWTPRPMPSGSTRLQAVAPVAADGGSAVLTLDVPTLPAHIPGFLPIGLIASGYVDDVKKRLPDATGNPREVTVPNASARRVTLSGHDAAGTATVDDAVLMVHADRVYILAVDANPAGRPAAAAALDAAVSSIHWSR